MEYTCLEVASGGPVVKGVHEVALGLLEAFLLRHILNDVPGFLDNVCLERGILRILHSMI